MGSSIPTETLCERHEQLYTGLVADALDARGYTGQTLDPALTPIERSSTFAGIVFPAVGRANSGVDEKQIRRFLEMVGDAPEHSVLALEASDERSAQVGGLTTTALAAQGYRGVVSDGGLRDAEFVLEQGFPVVYRQLTPTDPIHRWELLDWDVTVVVGGVEISSGDVIVSDVMGWSRCPRESRPTCSSRRGDARRGGRRSRCDSGRQQATRRLRRTWYFLTSKRCARIARYGLHACRTSPHFPIVISNRDVTSSMMSRDSIYEGSRRDYLKGVAAAGTAAGLAGCIFGDDGGSGVGTIDLYTWNLPFWEETITEGIIPSYEEEYGDEYEGLEADWVDRGPATEDIIAFFQSRLTDGDPPSIFDTQFGAYARYAEEGVFADIEELVDDDFLDGYDEAATDLNRYNDTLYQLPFYMGTNMTACNSEFFDQAGIEPPTFDEPWSTTEYLDNAEALVADSDAEFGLTFIKFDYMLWPWFRSEGIQVLNDDNSEATFNQSRTVELLERFQQLTDDGVIPEVTWTGEWNPQAEQFGAGDTGMYFGSGSALRLIQNAGEDWVSEDTIDIGHAPLDGGLFTFHGLGITTTGHSEAQQQAALDFCRVILNTEFQKDFLRNTTVLVPNNQAMSDLQNDDEFVSNNPLLVQLYEMYDVVSQDLWRPPVIPQATEVASIITEEFSAAALGETDPQSAVDNAESRVNNAL